MFKLLIADDEPGSREWLAQEIAWEDYDICIVGPAMDGVEAWQLIQEEKPEIILIDIRMPGMDGIDLAKLVMMHYPHSRILVISGYDEFSYAKSCLEIGVSGYILKPSPREEILAAVLKECQILVQRRANDEAQTQMRIQLEASQPMLREQFLRELFQGELEEIDLRERLGFLQLPLKPEQSVVAMVCKVEDLAGLYLNYNEKDRQLIWLSIYHLVSTALAKAGLATRLERGLVGGLIFGNPPGDDLSKIADGLARDILDEARLQLPCALQIGIGGVAPSLIEAVRSIEQAKQALRLQSSLGVETIATHSAKEMQVPTLLPRDEERLSVCLETGQAPEPIHLILQQLFSVSRELSEQDPWLRETGWILTGALVRIAQRAGLKVHEALKEDEYALLMQGGPAGPPEYLIEWWESRFDQLGHAIRKMTHTSLRGCIRQVKEYIDNHLAETISLSQVARSVFLSPQYLSRLFREQTNESFSDYVTRRKMEVARSLLESGEKKIYEVAIAVGYTDPSYFGRVFRQYYNVTPMDYKKV
jgi:two-component system response regulator YesN